MHLSSVKWDPKTCQWDDHEHCSGAVFAPPLGIRNAAVVAGSAFNQGSSQSSTEHPVVSTDLWWSRPKISTAARNGIEISCDLNRSN